MSTRQPRSVANVRFYEIEVKHFYTTRHLVAVPVNKEDLGVHKDHGAYLTMVLDGYTKAQEVVVNGYTIHDHKVAASSVVETWHEIIPDSSITAQLGLPSPYPGDSDE